MAVKSVTTRRFVFDMREGFRNARRNWSQKDILLVLVEMEDGTVGVGEGWTSYASPRALQATIEDDIARLVIGRATEDCLDLPEQCRQACVMSGRYGITAVALSAVEMALWDIRGKQAGRPLYELLGGAAAPVPVYASAGLYRDGKTPADLGREMAGYVASGFASVKLKIGGAPLEEDIARVAAVRDAIGAEPTLLVDAHYTMTPEAALCFGEAVEGFGVGWLEAPIMPTDYEGHGWLCARSPVPICGNETLPWREPFKALIDSGVHYIMPDVSACGGITETCSIAGLAATAGRETTLHSSSSIVLFLASLQVAAAAKNVHSVEYHMMHRWLFDLAESAYVFKNGKIHLNDLPGIGLPPQFIEEVSAMPV